MFNIKEVTSTSESFSEDINIQNRVIYVNDKGKLLYDQIGGSDVYSDGTPVFANPSSSDIEEPPKPGEDGEDAE